jgi:hypothetical protein
MAEIDLKFKSLRVKMRLHGMSIADNVFKRYHPATRNTKGEICVFCSSTSKITKEHVLPRWLFENDVKSSMISGVNKQIHTYNKAVIPACSTCNNSILAPIEKHIIEVIKRLDAFEAYFPDDFCSIIRWLEILEYKLQVYDCRQKYIKYGNSEYDPDWGIFPVAMMRHFFEMNPLKAHDFLRSSQRRITVKAKIERINSLIVFNPLIPHFNFFVQPNEYICVSVPMHKIAFFYFLKRKYNRYGDGWEEALHLIKKVSET